MEYTNLSLEIKSGNALLMVNRPQALNALNSAVLSEMEQALLTLERDAEVKVIVITGSGKKAFVAGADIKEMQGMGGCKGHLFALRGQQVLQKINSIKKPVIAAVNGFALGGGLELALACDFIFAAENAKFGFPEVSLGIIPGFGGTQNLSRLIGVNRAKQMVFSGKMINAERALDWGIVNEVVVADALLERSMEMAATIAANGTLAVGYAKDAIDNGLNMDKDNGLRYEASLFGVLFSSFDQKEGMSAFVEKRKASFQGH